MCVVNYRIILPILLLAAVLSPIAQGSQSLSASQPNLSPSQIALPDPFGNDWPAGPGRELTGAICGACHSLAIVKQQGLSQADWDELLDWMVEEQGMVQLEPAARTTILDYLATHFGIPP